MSPGFRFRPRLVDSLRGYGRETFAADLGAGVTVGIVALPLAMAFGIASGVSPMAGITAAVVGGFLVAAPAGPPICTRLPPSATAWPTC